MEGAEFVGVTARVFGGFLVALCIWGTGYLAGSDNSTTGYIVGGMMFFGAAGTLVLTVVEAMGL